MDTLNPKITISELGKEIIVRDLTSEEVAAIESATLEAKNRQNEEENLRLEKENAKLAVLSKLGLTSEEAKALLG